MANMIGSSGPIPIVALDVPELSQAVDLVERLGSACSFYKVGGQLFTAAGPRMVEELRRRGCDVFLDLKFHDIPNTVSGAVRSAAALDVRLVTVHASGGEAMLRAAVDAAGDQGRCGVLAVTVLTSLSAAEVEAAWGRSAGLAIRDEVLRLADVAYRVGAHGVVCGGGEARAVRERFGDQLKVLVPGVRAAGAATQDQARVVTAREAAEAGATYIVIGRAVTADADPPQAMARLLA
jgi:orotidine-5'-phosphate decarboxylase